MVDLNIDIGLNVDRSSIRNLQSQIRRAIRDTTPEIDIATDPRLFQRLERQLNQLTISDINADPTVVDILRDTIERNLAVEIRRIDPSQRALQQARREVQNALEDLRLQVELESRSEERISSGSVSSGEQDRLLKDRQNAETKVLTALAEEEATIKQVAEARAQANRREINAIASVIRSRLREAERAEGIESTDLTTQLRQAETRRVQAERAATNATEQAERLERDRQRRLNREESERQAAVRQLTRETERLARDFRNNRSQLDTSIEDSKRRLEREELELIQQQVRLANRQIGETNNRLGIARRTSQAQGELLRRLELEARRQIQSGRVQSQTGDAGGGQTITFRNAGDVAAFASRLDGENLRRFSDVLLGVSGATNRAQRGLRNFRNSAQSASDTTQNLNGQLLAGRGAAFDFGRTTAIAARRLLAWAAPAQLIFSTISLLREAVGEIIRLDTAARRLLFFQPRVIRETQNEFNDLVTTLESVGGASEVFGQLANNIEDFNARAATTNVIQNSITSASRELGISIEDVAEGFVTVARVGQDVSSSLTVVNDTVEVTRSRFLNSALALVQLEAGALSAERAVRGLQAIQAQFFGGRQGVGFITSDEVANIDGFTLAAGAAANAANRLAVASADTSANVEELIDATTRVGAAFSNIQQLNFDQTVALISTAFRATGATTGRLSTALRQVSTLISQNAQEIEELTDIEVAGADGVVRDVNAVFDVLEKIRDSAGQLESTELSLLIADRRNVGDIQALAQAVDDLRANVNALSDPQARANQAAEDAVRTFQQQERIANSLAGRINTLRATFVEFTQSAGVEEIVSAFIDLGQTTTSVIGSFTEGFGDILRNSEALVDTLRTLGVLLGAFTAAQLTRGAVSAFRVLRSTVSVRQQNLSLLQQEQTFQQGINGLKSASLLTEKQSEAFLKQKNALKAAILTREEALNTSKNIRNSLDANNIRQAQQQNVLQQNEQRIQGQIVVLKEAELALEQQIARTSRGAQLRGAAGRGAVGIAAAGALLAGDEIKEGISDATNEGVAEGVTSGLQGALAGAAFGGPIGAAAGAAVGIISSRFSEAERQLKEAEEEAKRLQAETRVEIAGNVASNQISAINRALENVDSESRERLESVLERLRESSTEVATIQDRIERGEIVSEEEVRRVEAVVSSLADSAREAQRNAVVLRSASERVAEIRSILRDNARLQAIISNLSATSADRNEARNKLEENFNRLQSINTEGIREIVVNQERLNRLKQVALDLQRRQNTEQEAFNTLSSAILSRNFEQDSRLRLQVELNDAQFNQTLRQANQRIDILNAQAANAGGDEEELQNISQEIIREQEKVDQARFELLRNNIQSQRQLLERANQATQGQIRAWEEASSNVVSAFKEVTDAQAELANIYTRSADIAGNILESRSESIARFLEQTGASTESRLNAIAQEAQRGLALTEQTFARQQRALSGGGFSDSAQATLQAQGLINTITEVIARSDQEITDERTGVVNVELAQLRQRASIEQQLFNQRIDITRKEIDFTNQKISAEISLLQERLSAEREVNELRRSQQEEFGRLLLESPDKFEETISDINLATSFFRNITDINLDSLQTIADRIARARGAGATDILGDVLSGLQAAEQFGGRQVIAGVNNAQLRSVFERIQVVAPEDIFGDLQRQAEEANSQLEIQRQIRERQENLVQLNEFSAKLQQQQIRIADLNSQLAVRQREIQIFELRRIAERNDALRQDFRSGTQAIANILQDVNSPEEARSVFEGRGPFTDAVIDVLEGANLPQAIRRQLSTALNEIAAQFDDVEFFLEAREQQRSAAEAQERLTQKYNEQVAALREQKAATEELTESAFVATDTLNGLRQPDDVGDTARASVFGLETTFSNLRADLRDTLGQNRFQLQQLGDRNFGASRGGTQQAARRLLRDDDAQTDIVRNLREALADTPSSRDFIDRLREFQDQGRDVDFERVASFFEDQGLGGISEQVDTTGQAIDAVNRFVEIAERLNREQSEVSRTTLREISRLISESLRGQLERERELNREARGGNPFEPGESPVARFTEALRNTDSVLEGVVNRVGDIATTAAAANPEEIGRAIRESSEAGVRAALAAGLPIVLPRDQISIQFEALVRQQIANSDEISEKLAQAIGEVIGVDDIQKIKDSISLLFNVERERGTDVPLPSLFD